MLREAVSGTNVVRVMPSVSRLRLISPRIMCTKYSSLMPEAAR